jgi:hypothetical protein
MNVVDSSGWIEFFLASANGLHFKPVIEDTRHLLVPVIALYEVHKRLSRNLPAEIVASCLEVMRLGRVLELTDARARFGASANHLNRISLSLDRLPYYGGCGVALGMQSLQSLLRLGVFDAKEQPAGGLRVEQQHL